MVGGDVGDGVGRCFCRVYDDVARESAVEEGFDAEVEVLFGAGDGGAEVGIGVPYLDDGGVGTVHCLLIDRRSIWFKPPHSMR